MIAYSVFADELGRHIGKQCLALETIAKLLQQVYALIGISRLSNINHNTGKATPWWTIAKVRMLKTCRPNCHSVRSPRLSIQGVWECPSTLPRHNCGNPVQSREKALQAFIVRCSLCFPTKRGCHFAQGSLFYLKRAIRNIAKKLNRAPCHPKYTSAHLEVE